MRGKAMKKWLLLTIVPLLALVQYLLPASTSAAAPTNDSRANAVVITSLPFNATLSTADATRAADDPFGCGGKAGGTVWYSYTPAASTVLDSGTLGSNF